jgi:hypothetical protein
VRAATLSKKKIKGQYEGSQLKGDGSSRFSRGKLYYIISSIKVILVHFIILIFCESFTGHFANYGVSLCN